MKRARTRLQSRIKPIKGYRAGGAVTPKDQEPPEDDDDEPEDQPTIEYHGYGDDYRTSRHPHLYKPYYGPRKEEPAWIQRDDDSEYGYPEENINPPPGREVPTMKKGGRVRGYQTGGEVGPDMDATKYWNTELDPEHEADFQAWAKRGNYLKDLYDYDMRGAYMSGIRPGPDGHWPDTYKKPNHPTFSEESQYHGSEGNMGGRWGYDETGSETLQPYDPRSDPQAFQRAINTGTKFAGLDRAVAGLGEQSNNLQIVDRLRHPTYEQLAADKDLRRGRTRMAPRGLGAEGGFGYQAGGSVVSPELHEYQQWLSQGVGQGQLRVSPSYTPDRIGAEGSFDYPVGNRGTSLGIEGSYYKPLGPGSEEARPDWSAGVRLKQKFRRGGVIKKFQNAGLVDMEGNPLPVTPAEPPQQPAPGASGQQVPATPPPAQLPVPTQPAAPPAAINTQPKEFADPLAGFKDEADVDKEKQAEQEVLSGGRTKTVRPSGEVFMGSPPPDRGEEMHPDFDKLQELKSMLPEVAKQDTSKGQRWYKEAQNTVNALERRVHNETIRQNAEQRKTWGKTHTDEIKKADESRRVGIMQIGDLDQQLATHFGAMVSAPGGYKDLIDNAKTPEERRAATVKLAASPIKQMPDLERAEAARSLLNLNKDLGPGTAAQLVVILGTPPMRGTKGVNGLTGRAAANYELGPKDPVGNFTVITPKGTFRVHPDVYQALKVSRYKGYDTMVGLHNDYITAKRKEEQPGWVARQTDAAIDTVRGLFK